MRRGEGELVLGLSNYSDRERDNVRK